MCTPRKYFLWLEKGLHIHIHAHRNLLTGNTVGLTFFVLFCLAKAWASSKEKLKSYLLSAVSFNQTTSGLPPPLTISPFYCQQQTITLWHTTRFLSHPLCPLIRSAYPKLGPSVHGALADDWHIWQCILLFQSPNGSKANECANDSSSCQPQCEKEQNHFSIISMEEILEYSKVSLFISMWFQSLPSIVKRLTARHDKNSQSETKGWHTRVLCWSFLLLSGYGGKAPTGWLGCEFPGHSVLGRTLQEVEGARGTARWKEGWAPIS